MNIIIIAALFNTKRNLHFVMIKIRPRRRRKKRYECMDEGIGILMGLNESRMNRKKTR